MINELDQKTTKVAHLINQSKHLVILSGAGLSTPSGIPDFRSANIGLWEINDPMKVASLSTFLKKPLDFFKWLKPLSEKIVAAKPNKAHNALAKLEKMGKIKAVVTQNIDYLHQKAGSKNVIEVHGSISQLECLQCKTIIPFSEELMVKFVKDFSIPTCEKCGNYLKPSITLFEEMLPYEAWNLATHHFEEADLVIVVGSSLEVYPANQLPLIALAKGTKLIINTISNTPMDSMAEELLHYDVVDVWDSIMRKLYT